jgi:hypothetical protein
MIRQILKNKVLVVMVLCLSFALSASAAYAWGGGRYYHRGGRWYRDDWFWFGAGVTALTIGAYVNSLPYGYNTVMVGGVPYYYYNGNYFATGQGGYVVVAPPMAVPMAPAAPSGYVVTEPGKVPVAAAAAPATTTIPGNAVNSNFEVRIPNDNGSFTLVALKQTEKGFLGPQGEFYADHPTQEQLKDRYVKK